VGIKALELQDHGIKNGLRDRSPNAGDQNILLPQLWPSHCLFILEFWGSKHKTDKIIGSKVACVTLCSPYAGEQNNLIPQQWPSRQF
jgi:hypothetical protein